MNLRRLVSGSCISTRATLLIRHSSRRWRINSISQPRFLMTLDSLGVTWLIHET